MIWKWIVQQNFNIITQLELSFYRVELLDEREIEKVKMKRVTFIFFFGLFCSNFSSPLMFLREIMKLRSFCRRHWTNSTFLVEIWMKQGRYSNDERRLYTHVQEDFSQNNNNNKYHMHF